MPGKRALRERIPAWRCRDKRLSCARVDAITSSLLASDKMILCLRIDVQSDTYPLFAMPEIVLDVCSGRLILRQRREMR